MTTAIQKHPDEEEFTLYASLRVTAVIQETEHQVRSSLKLYRVQTCIIPIPREGPNYKTRPGCMGAPSATLMAAEPLYRQDRRTHSGDHRESKLEKSLTLWHKVRSISAEEGLGM